MNASLTDRYVHATVRDLDDDQRPEVERELRATIADMIDGRLDAGAPSHDEAEREVLVELGDPVRLAAGYSGRPLYLIGPRVYPQWRRVVRVLLSTLVPLVTAINLVVRLFVDDVAADGIGPSVVSALWVGLMVAVNVLVWVTVVFALAERGKVDGVEQAWTPDQLPASEESRRSVGRAETIGSLVALLVMALALVWQQTSSPVRVDGEAVPVLDPALWSSWLPVLLGLLLAQGVLVVLVHRHGRWTWPTVGVGAALDVVTAALVIWLLQTDRFFDPRFIEALVDGGWATAARDLTLAVTLGVVLVTVWNQVETVRRMGTGRAAHSADAG